MSTQIGSLVVTLEADIARYTSGMARVGQQAEKAMDKVKGAVGIAQGALAALGVAVSVGALVSLVKGSIDAADHLRDMSQKTGIAVETLNGLAFAAGQAGGDLESMVAAAGKLNKSIVETAGGNKDTGEAFAKLGISVKDASGKLKSADVIMAEVADKFKGYEDGPEKAAIALRLFGKAGADMIPVLNDGGDSMRENIAYAKKYSGVTQELADASDNFNDTMGKLEVQQKNLGNSIAAAVLPILQLVGNEMVDAGEKSEKFGLAAEVARTVLTALVVVGSEVAFSFKAVGMEIGGTIAQIDRLAHWDLKSFSSISDAMKEDAEKAREVHEAFIASVLDRTPKALNAAVTPDDPKKAAPRLRAKGDDPTKALLEGKLKVLDDAYAKERDTSSFHEKFMQALRDQDLVEIETYEAFKTASIEQGYAAAVRVYDAEIAVLEKARKAAAKDTDRAELTNKINEKVALKEKARIDAVQDGALHVLAMSAAQSELNKSLKEWGIQEDLAAAQLQFNNDLYGKSALEIAKLTDARRIELDIEEKIRLAKEKGAITDEAIARYRKDGAAKAATVGAIATQARGEQIVRDQRTPGEMENERHANDLKDLQTFQAAKFENIAAGNKAIEEENQRHEQALTAMRLEGVSMAGTASDQLYTLLKEAGMEQSALGKTLFYANKAIAVAEILMNTELGAAKALALGPIVGPPLSFTIRALGYASAGIVAGMALAGEREKGGAVWDGGAFLVGEKGPELFRPPSHGTIVPNGKIGGGGDMKFTIVNQTTARIDNVVEQRISDSERALIVQEAIGATAAHMSDPNSRTSRALQKNFNVARSR